MSLFSSLQVASNAMQAAQIGLQVVGNNVANAATPEYLRQEVVLSPAPGYRKGGLILGLGVDVEAIIQKTDGFLEERLRAAQSDLASGEAQEDAYSQLEVLLAELSDTGLSATLNRFFGAINDVLNQPESVSARNLAALEGKTLASDLNRLNGRVTSLAIATDQSISDAASDINRLIGDIAKFNQQIVTAEAGDVTASDAVGLRDQRLRAMKELAEFINIQSFEQESGAMTVLAGGEYLVVDSRYREVAAITTTTEGIPSTEIRIKDTDSALRISSGRVSGMIESRDKILGGFLTQLNEFSRTLAFEFNRVFSSGQGLVGHQRLTSHDSVNSTSTAIDQSGLSFSPNNGSFKIQTRNLQTGVTKTTEIPIRLYGQTDDTTLDSLAASINAIDGLSAQVTAQRRLEITSDSANIDFSFAEDSSGILAALGINTFFTGDSAASIAVNATISSDPRKFNASLGGIGVDARNAELLGAFANRALESAEGSSISGLYDRLAAGVTQSSAVAKSVAEGFRVFQKTLEGQHFAISGVNLDEETVKMMAFQRMFQASARYIATLNELLGMLVEL
jgi:flagellar hook-associated protein 1 FlgK